MTNEEIMTALIVTARHVPMRDLGDGDYAADVPATVRAIFAKLAEIGPSEDMMERGSDAHATSWEHQGCIAAAGNSFRAMCRSLVSDKPRDGK